MMLTAVLHRLNDTHCSTPKCVQMSLVQCRSFDMWLLGVEKEQKGKFDPLPLASGIMYSSKSAFMFSMTFNLIPISTPSTFSSPKSSIWPLFEPFQGSGLPADGNCQYWYQIEGLNEHFRINLILLLYVVYITNGEGSKCPFCPFSTSMR